MYRSIRATVHNEALDIRFFTRHRRRGHTTRRQRDRKKAEPYPFAFCANTVASQAMYLFERPKLRLSAIYSASL